MCGAVASAQQPTKIPRIGFLAPATPATAAHLVEAFKQGLREHGYVEGQNVVLELRFGEAKAERFPVLAAELVRLKVDVIVALTNPVIEAVRQATQTIPIVMPSASDPVGAGFVASLARPGGNITGLSRVFPGTQWKTVGALQGGSSQALSGGPALESEFSRKRSRSQRDGVCGSLPGASDSTFGSARCL